MNIRKQLLNKARIALAPSTSSEVVISPCISVCRMTEDRRQCEGCSRSIEEIRAWSAADSGARLLIWDSLLKRAGLSEELTETAADNS